MILEKPEIITTEWIDSLIDLYHDPELRERIWQREKARIEEAAFNATVARNFAEGFSESLADRVKVSIADGENKAASAAIAMSIVDCKRNGREYEMQFVPEALVKAGIDKSVVDEAVLLCKAIEDNLNGNKTEN